MTSNDIEKWHFGLSSCWWFYPDIRRIYLFYSYAFKRSQQLIFKRRAIFGHESGGLPMIFTIDLFTVTGKNHLRITFAIIFFSYSLVYALYRCKFDERLIISLCNQSTSGLWNQQILPHAQISAKWTFSLVNITCEYQSPATWYLLFSV